jgi:ABC-type phosphate/phosphonate transport system substrate-binding protein
MSRATAQAEDVNLGIISTDSSSVLKQRWEPLIDDHEQANRPERQSVLRDRLRRDHRRHAL